MVCFVHFDFEMCFAPRRRALFDISTSKSGPNLVCVCTFFSLKCASRHNGVHFLMSHLASWLRTRRFSEPTFRPSAPIIGKTRCFATFLPFRTPGSSFFGDFLFLIFFFSSLTLPISAFHLSILSEVWLLNFLRQGHWAGRVLFIGTTQTVKNLKVPHPSPTGGAQLSSYD